MQVSLTLIWSLFRWGLSFQTLSSNHHAHPKRPLPRSSSPPASGWMIPAVSHRALLTSHLHLLHPCIVIMLWFHPPPTSSPQHLDVTVTMATCTHPPPPLQVTGCYLTVCLGGRDVDQVSIYLPVLVDLRVCLLCWCVICHRLLRAARVRELWDAERPPVEARRCRSTPVQHLQPRTGSQQHTAAETEETSCKTTHTRIWKIVLTF